jgi:glycosyltransferase involved in cell wall biosynthesis
MSLALPLREASSAPAPLGRRALFVSQTYPEDFQTYRGGVFARMHVLLEALRVIVDDLRLLFFLKPPADTSAAAARAASDALARRWGIDAQVELCELPRVEPPSSGRIAAYLEPIFDPGPLLGLRAFGPEQVAVIRRHLARAPDVVFVHRIRCLPAVLAAGAAPGTILLDLDDIEHKVFYRNVAQPPRWPGKLLYYLHVPACALAEARLARQARRAYICSRLDRDYLRRSFQLDNVAILPNCAVAPPEPPAPCAEETLSLVGLYSYEPNLVAAERLITHIWPVIKRRARGRALLIVGKDQDMIPSFHRRPEGVEFLGFVEDLKALYRRTRVVVCTVSSGGGTRTKILEAAAHGRPIVSTSIGAEGLELQSGSEILLRDDPAEFAAACVQLLDDEDLCAALGRAAHRAVRERFERSQVVAQVARDIAATVALGQGEAPHER